MSNPFFHRGIIRDQEDFIGRERETDQILGLLRNGQSVSLIGPRRMGKSSLLLHLCRQSVRDKFELGIKNAVFCLIDCQEVAGAPAEEIYEHIHHELLEVIEDSELDLPLKPTDGSYRGIDRLISQVSRAGYRMIILLDEFELLAGNEALTPYFFARLRGLTSKHGLVFLTASQRPLFDITADEEILSSPFFNIFVSLTLGAWANSDAYELFETRLNGAETVFGRDVIEQIIGLVGLHPFYINVAAYQAYQSCLDHGQIKWPMVEKEIELEAWPHLSYMWQNLNEDERYALAVLDGPIDTIRLLEQQWLVVRDESADRLTHTNLLLKRFVRRQEVPGIIQAMPFIIDNQRRTVMIEETLITLTVYQYNLLVRLAQFPGKVVPAESLEEAVWGESLVDDPDRLKTLIKRLRKAIEPYQNWIVSERGVGYSLRQPENDSG